MVNPEHVRNMTHAALEAMNQVQPNCSTAEILSTSLTILTNLISLILDESTPDNLEYNKQSLAKELTKLYAKVAPATIN